MAPDKLLPLQDVQHIDFRQWRDATAYLNQFTTLERHLREQLKLAASANTSLPNPSSSEGAARARSLEESLETVAIAIAKPVGQRRSQILKQQRIKMQIDQYEAEYEASTKQLLEVLNDSQQIRLQNQLKNIEDHLDALEAEFSSMNE